MSNLDIVIDLKKNDIIDQNYEKIKQNINEKHDIIPHDNDYTGGHGGDGKNGK
jgi:hypothetical protein